MIPEAQATIGIIKRSISENDSKIAKSAPRHHVILELECPIGSIFERSIIKSGAVTSPAVTPKLREKKSKNVYVRSVFFDIYHSYNSIYQEKIQKKAEFAKKGILHIIHPLCRYIFLQFELPIRSTFYRHLSIFILYFICMSVVLVILSIIIICAIMLQAK
jgi:hypothetical protein